MTERWTPSSWRARPAKHVPTDYPDPAHLGRVEQQLRQMPPLVFAGEARRLKQALAKVSQGRAFLLQGGDCAESFKEFHADNIRDTFRLLLQMAVVLTFAGGQPVVKVGRIAGQFAKPRSEAIETIDGVTLPSYRGDIINGMAFDAAERAPDPERLMRAYNQSASTLNLLRAFTKGGFADLTKVHLWNQEFVASSPEGRRYEAIAIEIERALRFMAACGIDLEAERNLHEVDVWTSHEGLLLDYEQGLTRRDSLTGDWYDCSAHMLWIGERTRAADGAHVAFFTGVHNPIGVKLGPTATAADVTALCEALNPGRIAGRLTLIARMGAGRVQETLPPLLRAARQGEHPVVWVCDPMHANMFRTESGYKTRRFEDILSEIQGFFAACLNEGAWPGGVHLEFTGEHVTECLGGSEEVLEDHLDRNYATLCDPRLNARQSLDLAFRVAELMRAAEERGAPRLP
jgi:3-deoxy-7-phosphoheptulonate synthase